MRHIYNKVPRIGQRAARQDRPCGATFVSVRRFGAPPCADSKRLGTVGTLPRGLRDGTSIGPPPAAAPVVRKSSTGVVGASGRLDSTDNKKQDLTSVVSASAVQRDASASPKHEDTCAFSALQHTFEQSNSLRGRAYFSGRSESVTTALERKELSRIGETPSKDMDETHL